MKKIFKYILISLLPGYALLSLALYASETGQTECNRVRIDLKDTTKAQIISIPEIRQELRDKQIDPTGKTYDRINTEEIETELLKNRMVSSVQCYKTPGGTVHIDVTQRQPVLRIINAQGSFYIDKEAQIMPTPKNFTVYLPLATGHISQEYARTKLLPLALYLRQDEFWNAQIEQIYITPQQDIELIPRIGDNLILLGKIDNFEQKLANLRCLYEQIMPEVGWNKYDTINIKYNNQVICTRRRS
ncbi:MAG: cell division protein FtsQ [Coprobacter sp.]|nr:cell division protein FtsQ [Coprobacter sp.]